MLKSIINVMPLPVFVKDENYCYTLVNQEEANFYGGMAG